MTEFISIYDKFLSKITDFSYASLEKDVLEEDLRKKVETALAFFPQLSDDKKVLNESGFVEDLNIEEQEIIANLMVINHFDKFIVNEDNMRLQLNSRDYKSYSQAGLLKELKATKRTYEDRVDVMKTSYSYRLKFRKKNQEK